MTNKMRLFYFQLQQIAQFKIKYFTTYFIRLFSFTVWFYGIIILVLVLFSVLGTYATFSATAPLAQTIKGGTRRGGANVKNNCAVAVARKKWR